MVGILDTTAASRAPVTDLVGFSMGEPHRTKLKVVFIAGTGRNGSTLLESILGELPSAFAGGELRFFWGRGVIENCLCGCGDRFGECRAWRTILAQAYGSSAVPSADKAVRLQQRVRSRHLVLALTGTGRRYLEQRIRPYARERGKVLAAIAATQNCKVIIDSSKVPSDLFALMLLPQVDLRVIHLVRDPRAVANSWSLRTYDKGIGRTWKQHNVVKTAFVWLIWNLIIRAISSRASSKYRLVRYEDFADQPRETVEGLCQFLDERNISDVIVQRVFNATTIKHSVAGNPVRFERGPLSIAIDNRWRSGMRFMDQLLSYLIAWPLAASYGYSLRGTTRSGRIAAKHS